MNARIAAVGARERLWPTRDEWIERAVIGPRPLSRSPRRSYVANRIRYRVSAAGDEDALLEDLAQELSMLAFDA